MSTTTQKLQVKFASLKLKPYEAVVNRTNNHNDDFVPPCLSYSSSTTSNCSNVVTLNSKGKWCITSNYFDSHGGANITLPLQLQFPSKEVMDSFLNNNISDSEDRGSGGICCIQPQPINFDDYMKQSNISENKDDTPDHQKIEVATHIPVIGIEAKVTLTFGTGHAMTSKVETVKIISTFIDESTNSILFYTNIMVRVSHVETNIIPSMETKSTHGDDHVTDSNDTTSSTTIIDPIEASKMKLNLEIMASYYYKNSVPTTNTSTNVDYASALQLLSSTNYHQPQQQGQSMLSSSRSLSPIQIKKLVPIPLELYVSLSHTLQISNPRTISHPTIMGMTYIAFTMTHANIHSDPIHVTNIVLHPHFNSSENKKDTNFKWGFVSTTTKDQSPLSVERVNQNIITNDWSAMTIHPHESQSILLLVEQQSSLPPPPLSIQSIMSQNGTIIMDDTYFSRHCTLTISTNTMAPDTKTSSSIDTAEAVYTTNITYMATPTTATTTGSSSGNAAMAPEMFHISMSLEQQSQQPTAENKRNYDYSNNIVPLGKPFIVNVDVTNPNPQRLTQHQHLKLVVLDHPQKKHACQTDTTNTNTTTGWQINDYEKQGDDLLMIDTNVVLVHDMTKGSSHHAGAATTTILRGQLRIIPLRTGTVAIPNFYIMDTTGTGGNIYYCYHKFQAIVL